MDAWNTVEERRFSAASAAGKRNAGFSPMVRVPGEDPRIIAEA